MCLAESEHSWPIQWQDGETKQHRGLSLYLSSHFPLFPFSAPPKTIIHLVSPIPLLPSCWNSNITGFAASLPWNSLCWDLWGPSVAKSNGWFSDLILFDLLMEQLTRPSWHTPGVDMHSPPPDFLQPHWPILHISLTLNTGTHQDSALGPSLYHSILAHPVLRDWMTPRVRSPAQTSPLNCKLLSPTYNMTSLLGCRMDIPDLPSPIPPKCFCWPSSSLKRRIPVAQVKQPLEVILDSSLPLMSYIQ